ncbi:hypothetical protein QR685DRAFT_576556 [Neurospora intermedia]|uniref:Uncharacterized protein n=1 Tax=Neurospora intermedia TaxID=5142 RepID=A0ABR3CX66_NEUIN
MIYGCFLHPAIGQPMGRTIQNHRGPCLSCSHGKAERWEPRHPTIRRQRALGAARANCMGMGRFIGFGEVSTAAIAAKA